MKPGVSQSLTYIAASMSTYAIRKLWLTQFKNYRFEHFTFQKKIVGICGANGTGKTNLLDAIYYLCFTKSYFVISDAHVATHGCQGFRLAANFDLKGENREVIAILRENGKKEISFDNVPYTRLSAHIGKLPAVIIAPDDIALITGGSEGRRKLVDVLLSQLYPDYLQQLINYNKLLQQRNSLLKQLAEQRKIDTGVLEIIDHQLAGAGVMIFRKRAGFLESFLPVSMEHYKKIAQAGEDISVSYESQLKASNTEDLPAFYTARLAENRGRDLQVQRTLFGIHRDDIKLEMGGHPFKQTASQGQRKSLLFALKLTEFEMLQKHKGFAPILLLDDVFEKLDNTRMFNLLKEVCVEKEGQVFITDTHRERLEDQLAATGCDYEIIEIL